MNAKGQGSVHHVQQLLHHYGYAGVFFVLLAENIGIPFPAETTLTISGIEWTHGVFRLLPLLLAAALGNIVGSTIAYGIGRFLGRPVIVRFGKYVGINDERLDKANALFTRYESPVILFGKFIAGVRVVIPYLAGINKVSFGVFSLYNAVSALVWAAVFIIVGKYIGIEWARYHAVLHQYMIPAILVAVILVAGFFAWKTRERRRRRR
ncbi:DedA family protein [Alicyclobacillus cycloheptanicus]|uniref:Membrane protein DedA with SNARE-associated domain n=1 Tax=Alicyclobacillus cycloheptanicus TaxID=1457 RepID=A0ABT9XHK2_9BACL|nr:DedA family protein [Alicyclobacillus cycloheptanicus]MDQ0189789.1 membrane protein DedA with SNARE-associated domain [Alicyclobacillus cycloheptanicus]WDM02519.1 DedA family protein [Alicyclobacillus cycloheptanicus]